MLGDYEHADKADYHEDGQFEMVTGKNFFHNRHSVHVTTHFSLIFVSYQKRYNKKNKSRNLLQNYRNHIDK